VDAGYSWYDQYECKHCGDKTASGGRWLILPKVGVNLSVPLGGNKESLARRCDCDRLASKPDSIAQEPIAEEEPVILDNIDVEPIVVPIFFATTPVVASVPKFEVPVDQMTQLRSRLLRSEEEYEPYDETMALSADPRNVFLFFDVNVTKMDRSFIQNDLLMDSIMNILGEAMEDSQLRITHIRIVGFASFDGRQAYNVRLAGERAKTIKEYMQSVYPALRDSIFDVCNGGESWAELRYQLGKVDFDGRDEVIRIIDEEANLDEREKRIKQYRNGGTYRYMKERLKKILRNLGCITIFVER
jgi:hypothetical protein